MIHEKSIQFRYIRVFSLSPDTESGSYEKHASRSRYKYDRVTEVKILGSTCRKLVPHFGRVRKPCFYLPQSKSQIGNFIYTHPFDKQLQRSTFCILLDVDFIGSILAIARAIFSSGQIMTHRPDIDMVCLVAKFFKYVCVQPKLKTGLYPPLSGNGRMLTRKTCLETARVN